MSEPLNDSTDCVTGPSAPQGRGARPTFAERRLEGRSIRDALIDELRDAIEDCKWAYAQQLAHIALTWAMVEGSAYITLRHQHQVGEGVDPRSPKDRPAFPAGLSSRPMVVMAKDGQLIVVEEFSMGHLICWRYAGESTVHRGRQPFELVGPIQDSEGN